VPGYARYGLEGSGIEPRLRQEFPYPCKPVVGPTQSVFRGSKAAGACQLLTPIKSSDEVKYTIELYVYSFCANMVGARVNFTSSLHSIEPDFFQNEVIITFRAFCLYSVKSLHYILHCPVNEIALYVTYIRRFGSLLHSHCRVVHF
jgi:hypothetical protein